MEQGAAARAHGAVHRVQPRAPAIVSIDKDVKEHLEDLVSHFFWVPGYQGNQLVRVPAPTQIGGLLTTVTPYGLCNR